MANLPFEPYNKDLKSVLRKLYLKPLVLWLVGKRPGSILAQEGNSYWESAMTLDFFIQTTNIFRRCKEEKQLCQTIDDLIPKLCRWMLANRQSPSTGFYCWDKVTWDSAVVLKTLLTCLKEYPSSFSDIEKVEIYETAKGTMRWLNSRFYDWESKIKYPFGSSDVAQIMVTGLFIKKQFPVLYQELKEFLEPLQNDIVDYLLEEAPSKAEISVGENKTEQVIWWDDYFETAEVLESFALYYCDLKHPKNEKESTFKIRVEKAILDAIKYIEQSQQDGMWGTHVDTLRMLYTYVSLSSLFPKVSLQPHLIFKALRWVCDEKQRFSDGSFLHTMFLTIFMAPALVAVHNQWSPARKTISEIYDDALWASPVQNSVERMRRFDAENRMSELQKSLENIKIDRDNRGKWIATIGITTAIIMTMISLGLWNGSLSISVRVGDLFVILPVGLTIYGTALIAIWSKR